MVARVDQRGRLTDAPDLARVVLRRPVRDVVVRRVRHPERERVTLGLGGDELVLRLLQIGLHRLELLELLGCRLPLELRPCAELVDPRDEGAPPLVGLEEPVEGLGRPLARERGPNRLGIRAGCPEIDHVIESRTASITDATPSSAGPGQVASAIARSRAWAPSTATPNPTASSSSTSFSPSPNAITRSSSSPSSLATNVMPRPLRDIGVADLEHVRQRGREERPPVEPGGEPRADLGKDGGLRHGDQLRRRPVEPGEEVADLDDGQPLEDGVSARVVVLLGDVQLVVDVDVRRDAERPELGDRVPCGGEVERLVQQELARPRVDHGCALVADDRVREPHVVEVAPDRPEHPSGCDEDGDAGGLRPRDRRTRAVAHDAVGGDQRAIEVAGEGLHSTGEVREKAQPPVAEETNSATSAICCGCS